MRFARAYYHCEHCRQGQVPWDDTLRCDHTELTPGAAEVAALAGIRDSFAEAAEALAKLAGLRLSESSVERTTETAGQGVKATRAAGRLFGPHEDWLWHKDAEGKTVAYVGVDATGVGIQGPKAGHAEGRMVNVATVYNPVPPERERWANPQARARPHWQGRYLASLESLADWGDLLRREACQVGMDRAERWIALSDGGNGLEDYLRRNFPRVEAVIIDFWHVGEHLRELAKVWHGAQTPEAKEQHEQWCHTLKAEGGTVVLGQLRALTLGERSAAAKKCWEETVGFFENHKQRMHYAEYVRKGWQIGSGPVESACKRVVNQRLKCAGMRWGEAGSEEVCQLRALWLSEGKGWDDFWQNHR